MFEKTFSFWRRIVGAGERPQAAANANEDRRVWARFDTELQVQVQSADAGKHAKMPAVMRDLSLGGANLTLDASIEPGHMIRLEIPGNDGAIRTVLACVVRSNQQADRSWSIGCVFSRELTNDDLNSFGAQRIAARPEDKRTWVRFDCNRTVAFRRISDPNSSVQSARLLNISSSGIGLSNDAPVEAGSLINVELHEKTGPGVRKILACVVHTTQHASGDYALGCNFIHVLSEDELQSLL